MNIKELNDGDKAGCFENNRPSLSLFSSLFLAPSTERKAEHDAAPISFQRRETRTGFYGRLFTIEVMRKAAAAPLASSSSSSIRSSAKSAKGPHRPTNANYANYVACNSDRIIIDALAPSARPLLTCGDHDLEKTHKSESLKQIRSLVVK